MLRHSVSEGVGWYGLAAILGAYAASNLGWLAFGGTAYQLLNLSGALALIVDIWPTRNRQTLILNAVWAIVAAVALIR